MRNLDNRIKTLEKRLNKVKQPGTEFCRNHLPMARFLFENKPEPEQEIEKICPQCGKPFPPDVPRMVIFIEGEPKHATGKA